MSHSRSSSCVPDSEPARQMERMEKMQLRKLRKAEKRLASPATSSTGSVCDSEPEREEERRKKRELRRERRDDYTASMGTLAFPDNEGEGKVWAEESPIVGYFAGIDEDDPKGLVGVEGSGESGRGFEKQEQQVDENGENGETRTIGDLEDQEDGMAGVDEAEDGYEDDLDQSTREKIGFHQDRLQSEVDRRLNWVKYRHQVLDECVSSSLVEQLAESSTESPVKVEIAGGAPKMVERMLRRMAVQQILVPISSEDTFFDRLRADADLADWILRLVVHPYQVKIDHPALTTSPCDGAGIKSNRIYYYVRCFPTTAGQEIEDLQQFYRRHPAYGSEVQPKLRYLEPFPADTPVVSTYFGQTIGRSPAKRVRNDERSKEKTFFNSWLAFTSRKYTAYTITGLTRKVAGKPRNKMGRQLAWLGQPELRTSEVALVLSSCKAGFNSATGGLPQEQIDVTSETGEMVNKMLAIDAMIEQGLDPLII